MVTISIHGQVCYAADTLKPPRLYASFVTVRHKRKKQYEVPFIGSGAIKLYALLLECDSVVDQFVIWLFLKQIGEESSK